MLSRWPPDFAAWTPNDWSAAGQVSTALIAIAAAVFALLQVRRASKDRRERDLPYVVVYFELSKASPRIVNLCVENIGRTIARDVKMSFDRQLESKARTGNLNDAKIIKDGISTMPPGMKLSTLFDLTHERFKSDLPISYTVEVFFRDIRRRKHHLRYPLELDIYYGLEGVQAEGLHQIAKSLKDIAAAATGWTGRQGRLNILVKDEDYLDWSENWQASQGGDWPSLGRPYPAGRPSPSPYARLREPLINSLYWRLTRPFRRARLSRNERKQQAELAGLGRHDLVVARQNIYGPHMYSPPWRRLFDLLTRDTDEKS